MTTHYRDMSESTQVTPVAPVLPAVIATGPYQLGLKRVFDVLVILMTLPIIAPLIALMALMVKRDGGNAFYSQQRVGRGGQIYTIWKLRTMIPNAEAALGPYLAQNPAAAVEWARDQKLKNDPRTTRIGRILRKCSIDELPQLWNVFIGDMSLVGPRPMMPEQQDLYPGLAYYTQRPGITGTWQVSERNHSTFADRARFDTSYVANLSFVNDIKILFQTVRVVLVGTGY